jgi:ElaB/YqjD/DUF883 family membrane-anchored ribosome-binding protein
MAQDDRRADEDVARERARLSAIAEELARRTTPEYLKAQASELQEKAKVLAKDKARVLKDKAKESARDQFSAAKDAAIDKVGALEERAMSNSTGMSVLGALAGAAAGVGLMHLLQERREHTEAYRYGYGYEEQPRDKFSDVRQQAESKIADAKSKAGEAVDTAKSKAGEVAGQVSRKAGELREKIPSGYEMREKVDHYVHEDPFLISLGALAFGGLAGLLLPVSEAERRTFREVRFKAEAKLQQAGEVLERKLREDVADRVSGAIRSPSTEVGEVEEEAVSGVIEEPVAAPPDTSPSIH